MALGCNATFSSCIMLLHLVVFHSYCIQVFQFVLHLHCAGVVLQCGVRVVYFVYLYCVSVGDVFFRVIIESQLKSHIL